MSMLKKLKSSAGFETFHTNTLAIILFAIGRSTAAQAQLWTEALRYGNFSFLAAVIFAWTGHLCVALCIAEMASALPFTGGTYGFRGLRGPFAGYVVGTLEMIINTANAGLSMFGFGLSCAVFFQISPDYEPLFWLIPILLLCICEFFQRRLLWNFSLILCCAGIVFIILYIIASSLSYHSIDYLRDKKASNAGEVRDFFTSLPYQSYMFISIEILPVVAHEALKPDRAIPLSIVCNTVYLFITTVVILFLVTTQYPGTKELKLLHVNPLPLSFGYAEGFGITVSSAAAFSAVLFLTALMSASYILIRIVDSMAHSKLLPAFLTRRFGLENVPVAAVAFVISQQIMFAAVYHFTFRFEYNYFIHINGLGSMGLYTIYFIILRAYMKFVQNFTNVHRHFSNPLGIYSAYWGCFVFIVVFVGALVRLGAETLPFYFIWLGLIYGVYKKEVEKLQKFTEEEEKVFLQT